MITNPALARQMALVVMLIAATLAVSCGSPEVRTTPRTTPQTGQVRTAPPSSPMATRPPTTVRPTDTPEGPLAMGFTECPPPGQASAAGYAATDTLHPAVVVKMTAPRPGWISYDSPDPIYYNNVRATIENLQVPETWLAADVAELQLIICVTEAPLRETTLETCHYSSGVDATFTIYRGDVAVSAYDARTGAKIDERVIEEQAAGRCPLLWDGQSTTARGQMPPVTEVEEAIQHFVMPARDPG